MDFLSFLERLSKPSKIKLILASALYFFLVPEFASAAACSLSVPPESRVSEFTVTYNCGSFPGSTYLTEGGTKIYESGGQGTKSITRNKPEGKYTYELYECPFETNCELTDSKVVNVNFTEDLSGGSVSLQDFREYDIYYGDINGDGIDGDIYFRGRDTFVMIHGEVIVPLRLDGLPGFLLARNTEGYDAAQEFDVSFYQLSLFTKANIGIDYLIGALDSEGFDDILVRGKTSSDPAALIFLDALNSIRVSEITQVYGSGWNTTDVINLSDRQFSMRFENADSDPELELVIDGGRLEADWILNPIASSSQGFSFATYRTNPVYLPSSLIGSSNGSFRVTEQGQASYQMNIQVPAGTAGVVPSVGVGYSSGGGDSLMGLGWRMTAFHSIAVCSKARVLDGTFEPLNYDGTDPYCYNGQRLILDTDGYYKTQLDSQVRVKKQGDYFTVESRDGLIRYLGYTSASRQLHGSRTIKWAESKSCDSRSNCIDYSYSKVGAEGHLQLNQINYAYGNGTSASKIVFDYEDKLTKEVRYRAGIATDGAQSKRLKAISVHSKDSAGVMTELRRYDIHYARRAPDDDRYESRVVGIQECVGQSCLKPTTFEWQSNKHAFSFNTGAANWVDDVAHSNGFVENILPMDIDGDGYLDIAWLEGQYDKDIENFLPLVHARRYYPSANRFIGPDDNSHHIMWPSTRDDEEYALWKENKWKLHALDYNADGRMDLAILRDKLDEWHIRDSRGDMLEGSQSLVNTGRHYVGESSTLMDVNGDGLQDLISESDIRFAVPNPSPSLRQPYVFSATKTIPTYNFTRKPFVISTGEGHPNYGPLASVHPIADIDGDGLGDVLVIDRRRKWVVETSGAYSRDTCAAQEEHYFVLHNRGDGRFDEYAYLGREYITNLHAELDTDRSYCWGGMEEPALRNLTFADVNADGYADLFIQHGSGYYLHLNKGTGEFIGLNSNGERTSAALLVQQFASAKAVRKSGIQLIDLNQDGFGDVLWHEINDFTSRKYIKSRLYNPETATFAKKVNHDNDLPLIGKDDTYLFVDFNADGSLDLLHQWGQKMALYLNTAPATPYEVTKIKNGLGAETDIHYEWSVGSSHFDAVPEMSINRAQEFMADPFRARVTESYSSLNDYQIAHRDDDVLTQPITVPYNANSRIVVQIDSSAPAYLHGEDNSLAVDINKYDSSNKSSVEYSYGLPLVQPGGFGFLGFRLLETKSPQGKQRVKTQYRQDWPFIGMPDVTEVDTAFDTTNTSVKQSFWSIYPLSNTELGDWSGKSSVSEVGIIRVDNAGTFEISQQINSYALKYVEPAQTSSDLTDPSNWFVWEPRGVWFFNAGACDSSQLYGPVKCDYLPSSVLETKNTFDRYGNATETTSIVYDGAQFNGFTPSEFLTNAFPTAPTSYTSKETKTLVSTYTGSPGGQYGLSNNGANYSLPSLTGSRSLSGEFLGRITSSTQTTTRQYGSQSKAVTHASYFSYYPSGSNVGQLKQEVFVPKEAGKRVKKEHFYDNFGNKQYTITYASNPTVGQAKPSDSNYQAEQARYSAKVEYDPTGRFPVTTYGYFTALGQYRKTSEILAFNASGGALHTTSNVTLGQNFYEYDVLGRVIYSADNVGNATGSSIGSWSKTEYLSCNSSLDCPAGTAFVVRKTGADGSESLTYLDIVAREIRSATLAFDGSRYSQTDVRFDAAGYPVATSEPYYRGEVPAWNYTKPNVEGSPVYARNADGAVTLYEYKGMETIVTDARSNQTKQLHNGLGQLIRATDALGGTLTYSYNLDGHLEKITKRASDTDAYSLADVITTLKYDSIGNKTELNDPDKGLWQYFYNGFGELVWQKDANGNVTTQQFDSEGRLVQRKDYAPAGIEQQTTWYYDGLTDTNSVVIDNALGKPSAVVTAKTGQACVTPAAIECVYTQYDDFGRAKEAATALFDRATGASLGAYSNRTEYDPLGRVEKVFDALDGTVKTSTGSNITSGIRNDYNATGYLASIIDLRTNTAVETIVSANARGQTTRRLLKNGVSTTLGYDTNNGLLTSIYSQNATASTLQNRTYTWDLNGNLSTRLNQNLGKNIRESYCYDALNRLKVTAFDAYASFDCASPYAKSAAPDQSIEMIYDDYGNIRRKQEYWDLDDDDVEYFKKDYFYEKAAGSSYSSYAGPHAVTRVDHKERTGAGTSIRYAYDANGNRTQDERGRTYTYTTFDKVKRLTKGSHITTFDYGAGRGRFYRKDVNGSTVTETLYLGGVERVKQGNTVIWKRYIGGSALWEVATNAANVLSATPYKESYMLKDHIGSTDIIVDSISNVVQAMSFDPWGKRYAFRSSTNPAYNHYSEDFYRDPFANTTLGQVWSVYQQAQFAKTTRGFTGHEMIDELGIIHMNGRIYDQELGLFLQADPLVQATAYTQSYNRYAYMMNNPLSGTDPSGYGWRFELRRATGAILIAVASVYCGGTCTGQLAMLYVAAAAVGTAVAGGDAGDIGLAVVTAMLMPGGGAGINPGHWSLVVAQAAVVGGVASYLSGGKFGRGALAAGIGAFMGAQTFFNVESVVLRVGLAALVGGTASEITGGKFKNGAATAAFAALVTETASGGWRNQANEHGSKYSKIHPSKEKQKTIDGFPAEGRDSFTKEAIADIDSRVKSACDSLCGTKHGDVKRASVVLSKNEDLIYLNDVYHIEVGSSLSPDGTIRNILTDYHHSSVTVTDKVVGGAVWHLHPNETHVPNVIGKMEDNRAFSGADQMIADNQHGWSFIRNSDGSLWGYDSSTLTRHEYDWGNNTWKVTGSYK